MGMTQLEARAVWFRATFGTTEEFKDSADMLTEVIFKLSVDKLISQI